MVPVGKKHKKQKEQKDGTFQLLQGRIKVQRWHPPVSVPKRVFQQTLRSVCIKLDACFRPMLYYTQMSLFHLKSE